MTVDKESHGVSRAHMYTLCVTCTNEIVYYVIEHQ